MPLLEMILPRRDKINEHLLDDGSDVNIQERRSFMQKEPRYPFGLCLCYPKEYISNSGAQKKR